VRGCAAFAIVIAGALVGCTHSPITATRIEAAIAPTFANLVHLQLSRMGLPAIAASSIKVTANCRKLAAWGGPTGAGDWVCTLGWYGPNGSTLMDRYDLSVATDGCFTATVDGAEAHLGGPTLKALNGRDVRNVLYTFEGCFDTT
jgi:hypothetical protein